jgi:uncharacterized protein with FMN-binding domain
MIKALHQNKPFYLYFLSLLLFACLFTGCFDTDTDSLIIETVDLQKIKDGTYEGEYKNFPVIAVVSIKVKNHKITEIDIKVKNHKITEIEIIKHREGKGEKAEAIIEDVIRAQSLEVDTISGATRSSKCILKAIENALQRGI